MTWKANAYTDLTILDGNILDISSLVLDGPAGQYGRVIINSDGHFAFANASSSARRFLCATNPFGPPGFSMNYTDAVIDAFAHQLRVHGYNMVRLHRIQQTYMIDATADFDFNPTEVERVHYLLAALKAEGIYWTVDIISDNDGGYLNPAAHNLKPGVYWDTDEQNHWKACADNFWDVVNPYTGLTTLADPALAFVVLMNEGVINVMMEGESVAPAGLEDKFVDWLIAKYTDTTTMCTAWGDCTDDNLETRNVNMPINSDTPSARQADMQHFFSDLEGETADWMADYLVNTLGYSGLMTSINQSFAQQNVISRGALSFVDMHAYHDYGALDTRSNNPLTQTSAIYSRHIVGQKYLNKPFTLTESGALFWNKWRHQNGMMVGAYAALQGLDMICEHSTGSIELNYTDYLRREELRPYTIGLDPITRVEQTLQALLFLREDVTTSPSKVRADISETYSFDPARAGLEAVPGEVTKISLVTGVGYYLSGETPAGTTLLEWDADAFDLPSYEVKAGATIVTDVKHSGTGAMQIDNPGPGEQRDQGYQHVNGMAFEVNFGDHKFYRWWMKMAADVTYYYAEKWKVGRWNVVDESVPAVLTTNIRKTGFQVAEHPSGFTSDQGEGSGDDGPEIAYDFDPSTNTDVQNWQEYVAELKVHSEADATDGWCKFYVYDESGVGGEVSSPGLTGVRWWSGTLSQIWDVKGCFMMWNYPQEVEGMIWVDECHVADTLEKARGAASPPAADVEITVGDLDADPTPWATRIGQLRTASIISAGNLTHDANNIYQSDTEEILLEATSGQMRVVTPKTEAAFCNATFPLTLTKLSIVSSTEPALVSVSAMDGETIPNSESLLIMIATDAQNTGMTFAEPEEETLVELGTLPVRLKVLETVIRLTHPVSSGFHLYALSLNGTRVAELPLDYQDGYWEATINTDTLTGGPTTFFEMDFQEPAEPSTRFGPGPGISIL